MAGAAESWGEQVAKHLTDSTRCPRCGAVLAGGGRCAACGADLEGSEGKAVWDASQRAADALRERDALIAALPVHVPTSAAEVVLSRPRASTTAGAAPSGGFSVQSLLAVAGGGLFAAAAVVFTFLNPDLTDTSVRVAIVAVVALVFGTGGWLLGRRRLRLSAEVFGALGVVFLALGIGAVAGTAATDGGVWLSLALGSALASLVLVLLGVLIRMRSWVWSAMVGLALTPAFAGYAIGSDGAVLVGQVAVVLLGVGLHGLIRRAATRLASPLRADAGAVTVLQLLAVVLTVLQLPFRMPFVDTGRTVVAALIVALLAVVTALAARDQLRQTWSFLSGAAGATAVALAALAVVYLGLGEWGTAVVPTAVAAFAVVVARLADTRRLAGTEVGRGALTVLVVTAVPAVVLACGTVLAVLYAGAVGVVGLVFEPAPSESLSFIDGSAPGIVGVVALVLGLGGAAIVGRRLGRRGAAPTGSAAWLAGLAVVAFVGFTPLTVWGELAVGVAVVILFAEVARRVPASLPAPIAVRAAAITAAHAVVVLLVALAWTGDRALLVASSFVVLLAVAAAARSVPRRYRPLSVAGGYAYALVVLANALSLTVLPPLGVLSLTVSAASIVALVVTLLPGVGVRHWQAVLLVTAVPFLLGVASVVGERSGWTGLSTAVTVALAGTLVATRRTGMTLLVRGAAAALLIPAVSVVIVSFGAQLLAVSASPVTLPIIATVIAATLAALELLRQTLERRGLGAPSAAVVVGAIEVSTAVTAVLGVLLALLRDAAGLPTTFLVLLILGIGGAAARIFAGRRYGWWVAAAGWTGALWTFWALVGIDVPEPYLLPPALGAVLVGVVLGLRGRDGSALVAAGAACAILPTLALLIAAGNGSQDLPWRALGLLAASLVLVIVLRLTSRRAIGARLVRILAALAVVSAGAGAAQGVRLGIGSDAYAPTRGDLTAVVLILAVVAMLLAAAAGRLLIAAAGTPGALGPGPRWGYLPAAVYLVAGPIAAVRETWFSIWSLWSLMAALLALLLVTAVRAGRGATTLPPVPYTFALAWITAVSGWSPRELRVEAFSLPLGLAVLASGAVALGAGLTRAGTTDEPQTDPPRSGLLSWPTGFHGSWALLAPGIVLTLLPSVLATGTDPQTWRAILVIALALLAILVGTARRLAAPFVLGLVVLPVENVVVFAVQVGRGIGALPWWITLATAGAVLLAIAVGWERRSARAGSVGARLRELR